MSVLSYPRLYVRGFMQWNPATGNNNDYVTADKRSTFEAGPVDFDWDLMKLPKPTVDDAEGRAAVRKWFTTYPAPFTAKAGGTETTDFVPAEWNYFGSNAATFLQYPAGGKTTTIVGGATGPEAPLAATDPILNGQVVLEGNSHSGRPGATPAWPTGASPGRLIDCFPVSVWSSQIYWSRMAFGEQGCGIVLNRQARMHSRWISFNRNPSQPSAGRASVTWQTAVDWDALRIDNTANSALLAAFEQAKADGSARGLMFRFNTYLTLYNQNGVFNEGGETFPPLPDKGDEFYAKLSELYDEALAVEGRPGSTVPLFYNPAYSRVVGVVGLWQGDDLRSTPEGRFLAPPSTAVYVPAAWTHEAAWSGPGRKVFRDQAIASQEAAGAHFDVATLASQLGPAVAKVSTDEAQRHWLRLDLENTFPEYDASGDKVNWGEIAVGTVDGDGAFTAALTIPYADYATARYEATGGLIDVPLTDAQHAAIRDQPLAFQANVRVVEGGVTQPAAPLVLLAEQVFTANTDERGIYLDAGAPKHRIPIHVTRGLDANGADAPVGTKVLVVQYAGFNFDTHIVRCDGDWKGVRLVDANGACIERSMPIDGAAGTTPAAILELTEPGSVDLYVEPLADGFPFLLFLPFTGDTPPAIPKAANYPIQGFAQVRCWPDDSALEAEFIALWNQTVAEGGDLRQASWAFIWENILYLYDFMFPVMLGFMPLGELPRVESAIDQLLAVLSPDWEDESTVFMPITRDLSGGRRRTLHTWAQMVSRNYPATPLPTTSV